jgi:addiction module HigA family antidote
MLAHPPLLHPVGVPLRAPMHPGRFLDRQVLKPLALTQTEAARRLGISRRRVNELVLGQRAMSADTAIRCALAFGLPAATWLALQADWDTYHAWRGLRKQVRKPAARPGVLALSAAAQRAA